MHYLILLLAIFFSLISNETIIETMANDPSTLVDGKVNALTGLPCLFEHDLIVQGAEPIPIGRLYFEDRMGDGFWRLMDGYAFITQTNTDSLWIVEEPDECPIIFKYEGKTKIGDEKYQRLIPSNLNTGFSNTSRGPISGRTNLQNTSVFFDKKNLKDRGTPKYVEVRKADGTVRTYRHVDRTANLFLLTSQHLPNGNWVIYEYDSSRRHRNERLPYLQAIRTLNPDKTKDYARANFVYRDPENKGSGFTIIGSDLQIVTYHFGNEGKTLEAVTTNCVPDQWLAYDRFEVTGDKKERHLNEIKWLEGRKTRFDYYKKDKEEVFGKKIRLHPNDRFDGVKWIDFRKGRVKTLSSPVGITHSFIYQEQAPKGYGHNRCGAVSVYDIEGNRVDYYKECSNRLERLERFSKEGHLQSIEQYTWAPGGLLLSKKKLDGQRSLISCIAYKYDEKGNILEESFSGIEVDPCIKRYQYQYGPTDLCIAEMHDNGLTIRTTHLPGTDRPTSQLTGYRDNIELRKFWEYNDDFILVREIEDDGSSPDADNLQDVTVRKIRQITPRQEGPFIGLPEIIEQKYWENGQEHSLGKIVLHYTPRGQIAQKDIYDVEGIYCYSLKMEYGDRGRLKSETDALDRVALYEYDANGNRTCIKDFSGRLETRTSYDLCNRPVAQVIKGDDGLRMATRYAYNGLHQLVSETDLREHTTRHSYDPLGRRKETQFPLGHVEKHQFDSAGNEILKMDCAGNETRIAYNAYGKPAIVIYADGAEEKYFYHPNGTLKTHIDPCGISTSYETDFLSRIISKTTGSAQEHFEYKGNLLVCKVDPEGNKTRYQFDGAGRKILEELNGEITTYSYDALNRLYQVQNGDHILVTEYDLLDRITAEKTLTASGECARWIEYEYDSASNKKTVKRNIAGKEVLTIFKYDSQNRLIQKTDPLGAIETTQYNDFFINNKQQKVLQKIQTDAMGLATIEIQDPMGRVVSIEKRKSKTLDLEEKTYTPNGLVETATHTVFASDLPTRQVQTHWQYDVRNRLKTLTEAYGTFDAKITQYTYTKRGEKQTITKPDGTILEYQYNDLGLNTHLAASDGTICHKMNYNLLGSLINFDGISRTYDPKGRILQEIFPLGFSIKTQYDAMGRKSNCSIPHADCYIDYHYRVKDLVNITRKNSEGKPYYSHNFTTYDLTGNLLEEELLGGLGIQYTLDPLSRKTEMTSFYFHQHVLEYDPVGNIRKMNTCGEEAHYDYDDLYQLTLETGPFAHDFRYDSLHNRIQKDQETYQVNALNEVTSHFTYDKNGNPLKCGNTTYTYDALDRLIKIETPQLSQTFTYDCLNRRLTQATHKEGHSQTTHFLYDGQNEIGAFDENNNIQELRILGRIEHAEIAAAIAIELQAKPHAPIHDLQGNIAALIPLDGPPTHFRYSAFGEERINGPAKNPWRFSSKRTDETGLVYYGRRYYSPEIGRWLTPDPAGFTDGMNLYAFVHNDPLTHVDEYGLLAYLSAPTFEHGLNNLQPGYIQGQLWGINKYAKECVRTLSSIFTGLGSNEWVPPEQIAHFAEQNARPITQGMNRALTSICPPQWDNPHFRAGMSAGYFGASCLVDAALLLGTSGGSSINRGVSLTSNRVGEALRSVKTSTLGKNAFSRHSPSMPSRTNGGWVLPKKGGAYINNRWYTEHALERMAPRTPQVMAELEARALERASAKKLQFGTEEFGRWMDRNGPNPRGIPPSVIEAEIANPGSTNVRVMQNQSGEIITVIPGG